VRVFPHPSLRSGWGNDRLNFFYHSQILAGYNAGNMPENPDRNGETTSPLAKAINTFTSNLSGLRDFAQMVGAVLEKQHDELISKHREDLAALMVALNALDPNEFKIPERFVEYKDRFHPQITVEEDGKTCTVDIPKQTKPTLIAAMKASQTKQEHQRLLYQSSLITLVSAAEWFLSQVIRAYFEKHPGASGLTQKTLTLEDLESFKSIAEARQYLLDLRIDEIMRGSVDDWVRFLKSTAKLNAAYLEPDYPRLVEIFQRRNVFVHNNGRANAIYLNKVESDLRKGVSLGGELRVSSTYLSKAIDLVEVNFVLISAELWKALEPTEEARANILIEVGFEALKQERWSTAKALSHFTRNDKRLSERAQMVAQMNYWQALKWQGDFEEARLEIEKADFSAKDEIYQLTRFALLDETKKFFSILPRLMSDNKLDFDMLNEWPIFKGIRATKEFEEFARKHKPRKRGATTELKVRQFQPVSRRVQ
jgi:hypothetical protein